MPTVIYHPWSYMILKSHSSENAHKHIEIPSLVEQNQQHDMESHDKKKDKQLVGGFNL